MARDRGSSASNPHPSPARPPGNRKPASRTRRALLALSPAALGAAGFFLSSTRRNDTARAAALAPDSGDRSEDRTAHCKVYYDRARF